jgi:uncharacterized membrane protein
MAETQTGLDENVAGALAYVLGFITGIVLLVVESDNRFVRFHAAQSIVVSVIAVGLNVALGVLGAILSFIPRIGFVFGGIVGLLGTLVSLVFLLVWLFLMYKAYSHERYELPVVGGLAASLA